MRADCERRLTATSFNEHTIFKLKQTNVSDMMRECKNGEKKVREKERYKQPRN